MLGFSVYPIENGRDPLSERGEIMGESHMVVSVMVWFFHLMYMHAWLYRSGKRNMERKLVLLRGEKM